MTRWTRPVPSVGDPLPASARRHDPSGWAFSDEARRHLYAIISARRDVRRFRPEPVDEALIRRLIGAAHDAPSVGHSQPWRFVAVRDPATRERAALMADRQRLHQATLLEPEAGRHLLDLQLEGIREAPVGLVVCCDRRVAPGGVLGRATYVDTDLWSCACAIENLWLAARAEGLGVGWVTLFEPAELAELVGLPDGVATLGWLCVGWPDERLASPGLARSGWSSRQPVDDVVVWDRWPSGGQPPRPPSRLRAPDQGAVVGARDEADELLTPPGSLGLLDRAVDRIRALGLDRLDGTLVVAAGRHPVAAHGVTAYDAAITDELLSATRAGESVGAVAARAAGLDVVVLDGGTSTGDLVRTDALSAARVAELVAEGHAAGEWGCSSVIALGEIGIANTTVAAAMAGTLLGVGPDEVVGLGSGADSAMVARKRQAVAAALSRAAACHGQALTDPVVALGALGGPEFALLTGVVLGAAAAGRLVVLDGMATSVAALLAVTLEPAVAAHLVAGQRSREIGHPLVLARLGLEPLLDVRLRAGEGAGAAMAVQLLRVALEVRLRTGRTT